MNKNRTPVIAGNWKMHNNVEESVVLVNALQNELNDFSNLFEKVEVVVAPTYTAIYPVSQAIKKFENSFINVAGQDLFWEDKGAYTGCIAGSMLKSAGANYAIIGHSERRQYFNETDADVNKKVKASLRHALIPIVCVGETLQERELNKVEEVVERQVTLGLNGLDSEVVANIIVAYEPVWAIGTGKTATSSQAEEVHLFIRTVLSKNFGVDVANKVRILYGGSVKAENSQELLSQPNIDGALVGGASLKAEEFANVVKSAM